MTVNTVDTLTTPVPFAITDNLLVDLVSLLSPIIRACVCYSIFFLFVTVTYLPHMMI